MLRKKVCIFCREKTPYIDYKNLAQLRRFIPNVKIQPRYYSGVCLYHQKKLSVAVKNARYVGFLPWVA